MDIAEPLAKGNMIVFKGNSVASGKLLAAQGAVQAFLSENPSNKAIYISLSAKSGSEFLNKIDNKSQLAVITASSNECEQFLTPIVGLKLIDQLIKEN